MLCGSKLQKSEYAKFCKKKVSVYPPAGLETLPSSYAGFISVSNSSLSRPALIRFWQSQHLGPVTILLSHPTQLVLSGVSHNFGQFFCKLVEQQVFSLNFNAYYWDKQTKYKGIAMGNLTPHTTYEVSWGVYFDSSTCLLSVYIIFLYYGK